jgi:organic radical activating enzyme
MNNTLKVSELFYSIQGEGKTIGTPSIFLRLTNCNLLCKSKNWVCDTIKVWKKGNEIEIKEILNLDYIDKLKNGAHLVISGGEPLLQQKQIINLINYLKIEIANLFIEIETNGTIEPDYELINLVNQWNCSPKLSNTNIELKQRYNEIALKTLLSLNTQFKFVVNNESDILEILKNYSFIDKSKIILMPAGENIKQLEKIRLEVVNLCLKYNLKYTDRLHIVIWNKKTGV